MDREAYEELESILNRLSEQKEEIQLKIDSNELHIDEAECFTRKILEKEEEDFRVFSPRKFTDLYKDELNKSEENKLFYQKENETLLYKRNEIDSILSLLQKMKEEIIVSDNIDLGDNKSNMDLSIIHLQEEDRQRIARDLHDTVLQNITHSLHKIELSTKFIDQDIVRAKLELASVSKELKEVTKEIRNTIYDLRPMILDDLGLRDALIKFISLFNEQCKYEIKMEIDNVSCEKNIVLLSIYRIIKECFHNIEKHADATRILFTCKEDEQKCLIHIEDNGKGFIVEEAEQKKDNHFGLSLIKERVLLLDGTLKIDSKVNIGTIIDIEIPLDRYGG